jgi:hypothetical protein
LHYAIGDDDGADQSDYTLGTEDTARSFSDGSGNVNVLVRYTIDNPTNSDIENVHHYKWQFQVDTDGWTNPTGGTTGVILYDSTTLTHGADTTTRLTAGTATFLSDNQGVIENAAAQNATFNWGGNGHLEVVHGATIVDGDLSGGESITFRLVHGASSGTEADGTLLTTYSVFPTINWNAVSSDVFFENKNPIEQGMKPQTAAGMGGVLIE